MKPTILTRFAAVAPEQPDLMVHLEWILGNLHSETIQALYTLCRVLEPGELEALLLALEANRVVHARTSGQLVVLTNQEKRVLQASTRNAGTVVVARALGITEHAVRKVRERIRDKYGLRKGDRLRGGTATVLALANHPFTFITRELGYRKRRLLNCLVDGMADNEIAATLDIKEASVADAKRRLDERLGIPYFCDFLVSRPARSLGEGGVS